MSEENIQSIKITCDRPSHLYHVGEKAQFTITTAQPGAEAEVIFTADGEAVISRKKVTTPCTVKEGLPFPGVLRCAVSAPGMTEALAGVAFDPAEIRAVLPEPEDFREFWQNGFARQEKIAPDFKYEELTALSDEEFKVFLIECNTVNDAKCYAFLRLPRSGEKMPLLVYYEGAGAGQCQEYFGLHCDTADKYLPRRVAMLSIFTHPYRPPVTREEHVKIHEEYQSSMPENNYFCEGLAQGPEKTFFYRSILGSVRMVDHVTSLPEIDQEHISYLGVSQGGGFGFFLTALCPRINGAFFGVPAFCDCGGFLAGHHQTTLRADYFRTYYDVMRYFDPVNFARMIKVPVLVSCGFIDTTCQPSGNYAAYNELQGNKMMLHKTCDGHAGGPVEYEPLSWFYVACHLGLCR